MWADGRKNPLRKYLNCRVESTPLRSFAMSMCALSFHRSLFLTLFSPMSMIYRSWGDAWSACFQIMFMATLFLSLRCNKAIFLFSRLVKMRWPRRLSGGSWRHCRFPSGASFSDSVIVVAAENGISSKRPSSGRRFLLLLPPRAARCVWSHNKQPDNTKREESSSTRRRSLYNSLVRAKSASLEIAFSQLLLS